MPWSTGYTGTLSHHGLHTRGSCCRWYHRHADQCKYTKGNTRRTWKGHKWHQLWCKNWRYARIFHTQVSSGINQEGKLIRCIWIIIVCQMTITLSSILLTEYVFLSFPRLKKEQVLLALFKVKKKKKTKLGSPVSFHYQCYPKIPDRGWQRAKDWRHRTSEEPREAFDLHWGDTGGFLWYHSCCSRRMTSVSAHGNQ